MAVRIHCRPASGPGIDELESWRCVPVAVAVDMAPCDQLDIAIRPIGSPGGRPRLFGPALTVQCEPPDFGAMLHALEEVEEGDVLVIAAGGAAHTAMIGEILCGDLRRRGCRGVICDGAVRDVATLAGFTDLPVFARHVNPKGPTSASRGAVNLPVMIGDRLVRPGDLMIGDDDGLIALSPTNVRGALAAALAKLEREAAWIEALESGRAIADIFGLEPPLRLEPAAYGAQRL